MQQWQSWALSCIGVIGIYLTGRKNWRGYAVGIMTECAWVWYAIVTKQWGFIFGSAIYITAYSHGIQNWLKDAKSIKSRIQISIFRKYK